MRQQTYLLDYNKLIVAHPDTQGIGTTMETFLDLMVSKNGNTEGYSSTARARDITVSNVKESRVMDIQCRQYNYSYRGNMKMPARGCVYRVKKNALPADLINTIVRNVKDYMQSNTHRWRGRIEDLLSELTNMLRNRNVAGTLIGTSALPLDKDDKLEVLLVMPLDYSVYIPAPQCEMVDTGTFTVAQCEEILTGSWSNTRVERLYMHDNYLTSQIRTRYAMFERPRNGLSNIVIDATVPRLMVASRVDYQTMRTMINLPKSAVCISPWFASIMGTKQMSPVQMCRFLGYTEKDLKTLMIKVKKRQAVMAFIGYGGTNVNTLHWLNEISKFTNTISIFKRVYIWEKEDAEFSNLLRFPKDPRLALHHSAKKLQLLGSDAERLSSLKPVIHNSYWTLPTHTYSRDLPEGHYIKNVMETDAEGNEVRVYNDEGEQVYEQVVDKDTFYYGAPGIGTRIELSKTKHFISATHGSNDCSLHLNPEQDLALQVESYGIIQLSGFFMNQLRMAIGLLEFLASDESEDLTSRPLMDYTFTGVTQLPCDRNYHFQSDFSGLMLDAEQATNI